MATPKNTDAIKKTAKEIYELINRNDLEHMGALYAKDSVHNIVPLQETIKGREGMVELIRGLKTAFPDLKTTVERQVADEDEVVTEFKCTGTHRGPLRLPNGQELGPTGRTFSIPMVEVMRFNPSGEVIQSREYWDSNSMLGQLGAI